MLDRTTQARVLVAFVAVGALCPNSLHAQDASITNGDSVLGWPISIRLVNGKNGKPITNEKLNVFINNATDSQLFRTDERGIIKLTVTINDVLSFASNIQVSCHPYGRDEHSRRKYPVREILEHGIADQNPCSTKVHFQANPGEFVFFERPRTFWEWMRL